ncbi:MAG: AAA family ATPase [Chloroflexota bacterium]
MEQQEVNKETGQVTKPWRPPVLVVMVGLPGTGKSHLARRLASRLPFKLIETDEIRHSIASPPTYSREESGRVYQIAHRQIDRTLRKGGNVIFDATNLYERGRRTLRKIAERNNARLLIVHTTAPEKVIEDRLRWRKLGVEPQDKSEAGWDVYCRMREDMEVIKQPHLVVDTSQELEPIIEEIVDFVLEKSESPPDLQLPRRTT